MMRKTCLVLLLVLGMTSPALAQSARKAAKQPAKEVAATEPAEPATGRRLFSQSCSVCHVRSQIGGNLYGPELSSQSLGGRDEIMRYVISNGSPRMPGFRHHFNPAEIKAIVAYLKTIPAPPPPAPPAK